MLLLPLLLVGVEVGDGPGNRLWVLIDVEALVNGGRDGLNFGAEIAFDVIEVEPVIPADQVDSQTQMSVTPRAANTMEVRLGVFGEIEIDDDVDSLNVDTTGEQIRTDQIAADTVTEIVEHAVSGLLGHLGMAVEARVAQLRDLLGQKFDAVGRVAEDDGLVDLELGEERVETVHLLLLLDEGIVLRDAAQGELVHEVDLVRADHVLVAEILDREGEGGGEEHDLAVLGVKLEQLFNDWRKLNGKQLVRFVHDEHGALAQVGNLLACQIEDSAGGAHHHVYWVLEADDVVPKAGSAGGHHDVDVEVLP